jgi:Type I phosphodiesterase / nucleotide pyrophosphatase
MNRAQPIHICVLIDALGWRWLEGQNFLNDELPYRQPLQTVLGFSSGAIPTILTGRVPADSGYWNLVYYDPKGSPFQWLRYFSFLPDRVLNHRITKKLIKEAGRRFLGMGSLFECVVSPSLLPCFNWTEKRNIYQRGGIPGSVSIFDQLSDAKIPYRVYSYHEFSDTKMFKRATNDLKSTAATFFFLYLSELDAFLHDHCDEHRSLAGRLQWYADHLKELLDVALQQDPRADMTIFSDHGMTPVGHNFDLVKEVESLGLKMPENYLAVYDSTMGRFWFFSDRAREQVVGLLKNLSCGRILSDSELQQMGIFFPDRRYGEVIFLLEPGWLMSHSHFNGKGWRPKGMHGYDPSDSYSDAIFLSSRKPATAMRTIADVYSYMQEVLQVSQ